MVNPKLKCCNIKNQDEKKLLFETKKKEARKLRNLQKQLDQKNQSRESQCNENRWNALPKPGNQQTTSESLKVVVPDLDNSFEKDTSVYNQTKEQYPM